MSVLNLLQKVKVQTLSFEKHPCKDQDQEVMIHYLNGLALLSQEDQTICDMEKEYLEILINSFGLSDDMLESIMDFAKNPNEKQILDMMQSFMGKEIKYNFIMDAMMIAMKDGDFDDAEKEVIRQYGEMFKLTSKEMEDLHKLFELFHAQDGNGLYRYFKRNEYMKVELFQYLLDYYSIDMAYELREDEKKLLTFEFFTPTFERGSLGNGATMIMTKPVNNAQFCIYLNNAFLNGHIEIDENGKVVDSKSKELLMNLDQSEIAFKDDEFIVNSAEDDEKKLRGVTLKSSKLFIAWVSNHKNAEYSIPYFKVSWHDGTSDDHIDGKIFNSHPIAGEFYYTSADNKNKPGFRISPKATVPYFVASIPNIINDKSTNMASFRMMKLPKK